MGRGNEDWSNGKIYRIISNNPEVTVVYYGSTCQKLCKRMASHRATYKRWCAGKTNNYSIFPYFKQHGIEQFHIELVEDFPCDNEQQLLTRENVYIRGFDCCNKNSAISTPEEKKQKQKQYHQDNRETRLIKKKQYAQDNKEQISIKKKQYRQDNSEQISINAKQHYQDNSEQIIIKAKQYNQDNKEQISIKKKEKMTCVCGCQIRKDSLSKHIKTPKHISLVQT